MTAPARTGAPSPAYRLVRPAAPVAAPIAPDPVQRHVISHTAGPLLVIGAPGTGKTATLVESVAARVEAGADPASILVLTFGRRGARRLRDRIGARLGGGPGFVARGEAIVRTFHGYAFGILRLAAARAGRADPAPAHRPGTGPRHPRAAARRRRRCGWPEPLRPALPTRAFAEELRDLLLRAAERGIGPARWPGLGEQEQRRPTGSPRPGSTASTPRCSRCATPPPARAPRTTTPSWSGPRHDAAARRPEPARRAAAHRAHVYVDELHDTDPAQIDLLSTVAGRRRAPGGVRRPGLVDVRVPRRRSRHRQRVPAAVPHRGRRARRDRRRCGTSRTGPAPRCSRRPGGSRSGWADRPGTG